MRKFFCIFFAFWCFFSFSFAGSDYVRVVVYDLCDLAIYKAKYSLDENYIPIAFHCLLKKGKYKEAKLLASEATKKQIKDILHYMMMEKNVELEAEEIKPSINIETLYGLPVCSLKKALKSFDRWVAKDVLIYLISKSFYSQDYNYFFQLVEGFPELKKLYVVKKLKALAFYRIGDFKSAYKILSALNDNFSYYWLYKLSQILGIPKDIYESKLIKSNVWDFYKVLFLIEKNSFYLESPFNLPSVNLSYICKLVSYAQNLGLYNVSLEILKDCVYSDPLWFLIIPKMSNPNHGIKLLSIDRTLDWKTKLYFLYPRSHLGTVRAASWAYRVDEDLVFAIIRQESLFNGLAVSRSGALGLMQILPSTGRWIADKNLKEFYERKRLFLPFYSIKYGVWYLSYLKGRFPLFLAIAAYNSGPNTVAKWLSTNRWVSNVAELVEFYPKAETRIYIKNVVKNFYFYRSLRLGF